MTTRLLAALFTMLVGLGGCGTMPNVHFVLPGPPSLNTPVQLRVEVETTSHSTKLGDVKVACALPSKRVCWFVDETVPYGTSVVGSPQFVQLGSPLQWVVYNKAGIPLVYESVPQVTDVTIGVPSYPIYDFSGVWRYRFPPHCDYYRCGW